MAQTAAPAPDSTRPWPGDPADTLTADGAIMKIRAAATADAPAVADLFRRASGSSLRLRFFVSPGTPLVAAEVARLTRPPGPDHATILAELAGEVVGVASYERDRRTPDQAEFAVFVADTQQGRGIGTLLMEHLAGLANRHGISQLYGEVLPDNLRMLRVARDLTSTAPVRSADLVEVRLRTAVDDRVLAGIDARDRAAGRASLRPLLAPASVAVVGAGREPGGVGHEVLTGMTGYGFTGAVYPVNRHADTVAGMPAYRSLAELPGPAELLVLAVPPAEVPAVLAGAAGTGTRAAVILTTGFAETGPDGAAAQAEVLQAARAAGIRLVGPNCLGVVNTDPQVRLDASFTPHPPQAGSLAVASQSGAVGITVLEHASRYGCGISTFVSLGNKADVSGNDLLAYWYDDPGTAAVALYLESFGNPRKFARVARAMARRKPVLAVFSGSSSAGQRAGATHTATAASSQVVVDTLFAQAGVVRAADLGELIDAARLLTDQPLPDGNRVAVLGNAGGANVLAADAAEAEGLQLPAQVAGRPNPLDLGADTGPEPMRAALAAVAASGEVDTVLAVVAATRTNDPGTLRAAVAAVADDHPQLPLLVVTFGGEGEPVLGRRRIPVYHLPEQAVRALGHATRYADWRRAPLGSRPDLPGVDRDAGQEAVRAALAAGAGWQPFSRLAPILAAYGIPLLDSRHARGARAAMAAADQLGYPVVVKAADPQLVHKSDLGVVRLDLPHARAVGSAYRAIAAATGRAAPQVLVQPMAAPGTVELVAGIRHDPLFGSLVMAGLGGVYTDLLDDRAFRLVPVTDLDAGRMWRSLRSAPLLTGYRGRPAVDTAAVEDLLLRLGRLAEDLPEVAELDLNPVLAGPAGVVAVDTKLRLAPTGPELDPALRQLR